MNKANRVGQVFANGVLAGLLSEYVDDGRDSYHFNYDNEYLAVGTPIGHAFPLTDSTFIFDGLPPFFENLLSEGWIRTYQAQSARLDKQDSFGLLLANGSDLIGAISVAPLEAK